MINDKLLLASTQSLLAEAESLEESTRNQVDRLRESRRTAARQWERFKHILRASPSLAALAEREQR